MSVFKSFLKGQFLSVYDETEPAGNFHICRYLCEDSDHIIFQAISTRGYCDGFYCIKSDLIFRIDFDDEYTKRIEKLFSLQNQKELVFYPTKENSILIDLLYYSEDNNLISSVFFENDESITGKIVDINSKKGIFKVEKITDDGKDDGIAFVKINSIEKIICNSGFEKCIEMLRNAK